MKWVLVDCIVQAALYQNYLIMKTSNRRHPDSPESEKCSSCSLRWLVGKSLGPDPQTTTALLCIWTGLYQGTQTWQLIKNSTANQTGVWKSSKIQICPPHIDTWLPEPLTSVLCLPNSSANNSFRASPSGMPTVEGNQNKGQGFSIQNCILTN